MGRLLAIGLLIVMAFMLIKHRTNEKLQKRIVIFLLGLFIIYLVVVVVMELLH